MKIHEPINQIAGNFSFDLNLATGFGQNDPILVGLSGWVDTPDILDTSIMQFAVNYVDATNNAHQVLFQANPQLIMNDATQFFTTDMVLIRRVSQTSNWTLDGYLVFGIPRNARYTLSLTLPDGGGANSYF